MLNNIQKHKMPVIKYTKEQLETQKSVAAIQLYREETRLSIVLEPEWEMAAMYGEHVRDNHVATAKRNIAFYEATITTLDELIANS
jgi:hypothetical protein